MWPNPQFPADLVTFPEEILNRKLHFCAVSSVAALSTPKSSKIERLENVKPFWKGVETGRFHCSMKQTFLRQPSMVADIFEDFEPAFKKFLATPGRLEKIFRWNSLICQMQCSNPTSLILNLPNSNVFLLKVFKKIIAAKP